MWRAADADILSMNIGFRLSAATAVVVFSIGLAACGAKSVPDAFTPDQVRRLEALPMPIAVPDYVPPGFKLVRIKVSRRGNWEYSLTYQSQSGREFIFGGSKIKSFIVSDDSIPTPGVPRTLAKSLGSPDDVKTDGGCTLATSLPFKPGRNGLVFTTYGCATDIRPADVVRVFESARFLET